MLPSLVMLMSVTILGNANQNNITVGSKLNF